MKLRATVIDIPTHSNDVTTARKMERRGMIRELFVEFTSTSTLHGLRYITDRQRPRSEKVFWAIITVISMGLCIWGCHKTLEKWRDTPIIISINERLMSVRDIPFPAVTICPQIKVKSLNLLEEYKKLMKHIRTLPKHWWGKEQIGQHVKSYREQNPGAVKLAATHLVCTEHLKYRFEFLFPDKDDIDFVQQIIEEAPTMEEIFEHATWRHRSIPKENISDIFTPVLTAEGVCYTFNGLAADEIMHRDRIHKHFPIVGGSLPSRSWSPDRGYFNTEQYRRNSNPSSEQIYPRRGEPRNLFEEDLVLVLGQTFSQDAICTKTSFEGFKVILHNPAELPQRIHSWFAAETGQSVLINIKADVVTTSNTLNNYTPKDRQCYLPYEKTLNYFKVYTPTSCELECITTHTLQSCGCFWFHQPYSNISKLCSSLSEAYCVREAFRNFTTSDLWLGDDGCQCMAPCHDIKYDAQMMKFKYNRKVDLQTAIHNTGENSSTNERRDKLGYTEIKMYFKDAEFVTLRRSEMFGSADFLASCGGLLGLFLGFSFLSLIELFYFFTIRLFYMLRGQNKSDDKQNANGAPHASELDANQHATRLLVHMFPQSNCKSNDDIFEEPTISEEETISLYPIIQSRQPNNEPPGHGECSYEVEHEKIKTEKYAAIEVAENIPSETKSLENSEETDLTDRSSDKWYLSRDHEDYVIKKRYEKNKIDPGSKKEHALRHAIRRRDVTAVKKLLDKGVSVACRDANRMTPLHYCTYHYCYKSSAASKLKEGMEDEFKTEPEETEIINEILSVIDETENKQDILDSFHLYQTAAIAYAILTGYFEIVEILVRRGASINKVRGHKSAIHLAVTRPSLLKFFLDLRIYNISDNDEAPPPIFDAIRFDKMESVKLLVKKFGSYQLTMKNQDGNTAFHMAARFGSFEILKYLFYVCPYPTSEYNEESPLAVAAFMGHKDKVMLLLRNGAYLTEHVIHGSNTTVLDLITQQFDDSLNFLKDVFNQCIKFKHSPMLRLSPLFSNVDQLWNVTVLYEPLTVPDETGANQTKFMEHLIKSGHKELLVHPLIESLLLLKWRCLLPVVYALIVIYGIFLISFNAFVVFLFYDRDVYNASATAIDNEMDTTYFKCHNGWSWSWITLIYLSIFTLMGQELFFINLQRSRYFVHFESWIKLSLLILSAVVPLALGMHCAEIPAWLRHMACAAVLLSWLQAMLLLSRFPDWGYYVLIFERVVYNVLKVLLTSVCLVIGFSLTFMIEYHSESPFDGIVAAFVKTIVMMSSEFEYEDLFGDKHAKELEGSKISIRLIFVVFVLFIAIVLMNFMIGVAVSDINNLNIIGNIRRLEKQVELQSTLGILMNTLLVKMLTLRNWFIVKERRENCKTLKYHFNYITKHMAERSKWEVHRKNAIKEDKYVLWMTNHLDKAIIHVAKSNLQRNSLDYIKTNKKKELDAIYNEVTGKLPLADKKTFFITESDDDFKKKITNPTLSLREEIQDIKHEMSNLKESMGTVLKNMMNKKTKKKRTVPRHLRGRSD